MNSKLWIHKALTMCLTAALVVTYSMVALANDGKTAGEIVVTGNSDTSAVTVNGEVVKSGRAIFSSSTISTPEGSGAIINLGKVGRIQLAPNTTFALSFDNAAISGDLTSGSITVLNAAKSVSVNTLSNGLIELNAGETASVGSGTASKQTTTNNAHGNWWVYALIVGGAVAGIVWAASEDNENNFGGSASAVSPTA